MDRVQVEAFLNRLPDLRVLVIGDLMLDEYVWGEAERISPEAPVQVVDVKREDLRLGGAGNVINNLASLGARVEVVSVLGDDADSHVLTGIIESQGLSANGIRRVRGRTTARKTRVLASNQQMLRIDRESRTPISNADEQTLLNDLQELLPGVDVVLLSDYQKGLLTVSFLQAIIALCRAAKIPVLVDPKGDDYSKYRGATLLTPNRKEAGLASGIDIVDEESLLRAGRQLRQEVDLDALVITRSEEGMSLLFREGPEKHLPTRAREVFDVTGAGDTVLTVLGLALAAGLSMEEAAELANVAAGIVVAKVGTSTVSGPEILAEISRQHFDTDRKIKSRDQLRGLLQDARQKGKQIVFTNGCFDLLHVGHVKYLQHARQLGDIFVLGLNSDDSIRRLKGDKRPLINQEERAHLMAALSCIDYVVIFDEDTPLELIDILRPNILVKGGDYTPEGVVGKDLVESYGGRVELIQFVDGKSTTNIINKILASYQE
jgi:D-beta-D-heptose 7-phosphate kinase/D-beta-D-heptose 1-phosphate adenosyltransferase